MTGRTGKLTGRTTPALGPHALMHQHPVTRCTDGMIGRSNNVESGHFQRAFRATFSQSDVSDHRLPDTNQSPVLTGLFRCFHQRTSSPDQTHPQCVRSNFFSASGQRTEGGLHCTPLTRQRVRVRSLPKAESGQYKIAPFDHKLHHP